MNLVQQANFLEDVPKEQLAQMSQDPNAQFPPFLVLSEIQRRTTNEKNYQAMQQQPTTTVAEEVVNEFMQPQLAQNQPTGLQGGVPQSATPLPDSNISAGLSGAPTAPMQMAASGGLTEYQEGGQSKFGSMMDSIFEVGSDVANWASENPIEAAATGLMFVPGIGWGSSAILRGSGMLYKGLKGVDYAKKAKQTGAFLNPRTSPLFTSPSQTAGKNLLPQTLQSGRAVPVSEVNRLGSLASRRYSPLRTTGTGTGLLTAKTGYDYLSSPADETTEKEDIKKTEPNIGPTYKKLMSQMNSSNTNSSKGLGQMDYRDMIRMGMGIMGAKDMSDLGDSVTDTLDAADARATTGLQQQYLQAQTDKLQADIAAMPVKEIQSEISIYSKYLDQLRENSEGTEADKRDIKNVSDYINALSQELMTARGIDLASLDRQKELLTASNIGIV
tara:strand:+ start:417 stop:1745 length:1329 start_codon:yes stop_codon:yes gene_type:complete